MYTREMKESFVTVTLSQAEVMALNNLLYRSSKSPEGLCENLSGIYWDIHCLYNFMHNGRVMRDTKNWCHHDYFGCPKAVKIE